MKTTRGLPTAAMFRIGVMIGLAAVAAHGQQKHFGFDVSNVSIPVREIVSGGPGRDGIPSIDRPRFVAPERARFLQDDDTVVSVTIGGETRAYPFRILVWHEIVNDRIGDAAFAVTYCPLCGTAMVFDRRVDGRTLEFGVSGLLYQSDMLMYDRQTESLWPQICMAAVSGSMAGKTLAWLPSEQMTWTAWRARYPGGRVLSTDTGHRRDYNRSPYQGYEQTDRLMFPVNMTRREFSNKEWMIGLLIRGEPVAIPLRDLRNTMTMERRWANTTIMVEYDKTADSVVARNLSEDEAIPTVRVFWFAWQAFYPRTTVWRQ